MKMLDSPNVHFISVGHTSHMNRVSAFPRPGTGSVHSPSRYATTRLRQASNIAA